MGLHSSLSILRLSRADGWTESPTAAAWEHWFLVFLVLVDDKGEKEEEEVRRKYEEWTLAQRRGQRDPKHSDPTTITPLFSL